MIRLVPLEVSLVCLWRTSPEDLGGATSNGMANYKFPEKFWWGSATSAHQIEGDTQNDWTEWEIKRAQKQAQDAKDNPPAGGWPDYILNNYPNPVQEENYISGKACDSYNRYREDFDIIKQLNQNIHRFSIEWSRIEPEEGRFDEQAMQHYVDVVKGLRDRGIEPIITLWHFTNPVWFAKKGGFLNLDSPKIFARYAKYVTENLKDKVSLWITFNEATTVYSGFSYLNGTWPPQDRSLMKVIRVNKNIIRAHVTAYKEIKNVYHYHSPLNSNKEVRSGVSKSVEFQDSDTSHNAASRRDSFYESGTGVEVGVAESVTYVAYGNKFYQKFLGKIYNYYRNFYFWTKAFPCYDFMGLNYYTVDRRMSGSYTSLLKQDMMPEMSWEIYPEGLYKLLMDFKRFKKPVYITENGIADGTDQKRAKFIKDHLYWVWRAIQDGSDVKGYLYWSLLDNFEWHHGFAPRFGLVKVDYKTFERHIRPSALEYAKICKDNAMQINE